MSDLSEKEMAVHNEKIRKLTHRECLPILPKFSDFYAAFKSNKEASTKEGLLRYAYYLAFDEKNCDYVKLHDSSLDNVDALEVPLVSASFVCPYPPGCMVLVFGQLITQDSIDFLRKIDITEIHGYEPELGLRVFRQEALEKFQLSPGCA